MNINELINKYDELLNKSRRHSAIQLYDNTRMTVEVCLGIAEFDENRIRLELADSNVTITGLELKMKNYNRGGIEIKGKIHSIDFEEK